jgi:hypothetical protein
MIFANVPAFKPKRSKKNLHIHARCSSCHTLKSLFIFHVRTYKNIRAFWDMILLLVPLGDLSLHLKDPTTFINVNFFLNRILAPRRIWKLEDNKLLYLFSVEVFCDPLCWWHAIEILFGEFKVSRIWHSSGSLLLPVLCLLLELCEVLVNELHKQVALDGRLRTCVLSECDGKLSERSTQAGYKWTTK